MMEKQSARVLAYIVKHGGITSMDAFRDLGITRLSARIWDLRRAGVPVTDSYEYKIENGKVVTKWKVYRIA